MDLIWGMETAASDRWIGALDAVIVDTESKCVTHLVIRRGAIFPRRHDVSIDHVARCDHEGIYLNIPMSEAFSENPPIQEDQDSELIASLNSKTRVEASDTTLNLKGLRVDWDSRSITHIILQQRGEEDLIVTSDRVTEMDSGHISLDIRQSEIENFPVYRLDHDIETDIWQALYDSEAISVIDLKYVRPSVADGVVKIEGNMRDPSAVTEAGIVAALVSGVVSVDNRIAHDWGIELKAASIIARIAPNMSNSVSIRTQLGIVNIRGLASCKEDQRDVITAIALIEGVRGVQDNIEVRAPAPVVSEDSADEPEVV